MKPVSIFFAGEDLYPDLDTEAAVNRLSEAIRCRTINYADHSLTDFSEFDRLQELIRQGYPHVMRCGSFELIGHAVLITIPGSDPRLLPCLYMSHQDVVPVAAGTEKDWRYDAFSGAVAEGFLWGRGSLDIKQMVFGILEAAEYLLSRGRRFRRTAYLAFGDDEETLNQGALAIAETLERRGVRLEFLLDEGGGQIQDGACFGAPGQAVIAQAFAQMQAEIDGLKAQLQNLGETKAKCIDSEDLPKVCGASLVIEGDGAPSVVPMFVGQRYHDTTNKKVYEAFAVTNSTADWTLLN